ncbi:MAG TPA: hypothetical protein PLA03_11385 [Acidobacteriota bacterium]|nr:hypothetical protein [Acidobacteriota bacterium]
MNDLGRIARGSVLLLTLAVSVMLMAAQFDIGPVMGDEGILAMDGWRIFRGEVPHRDFFQFIPPLAALAQAAFFKVLSPSVLAIRMLGLVYGLLLLWLAFLYFRRFIRNELVLALSLSMLVPFGIGGWLFGSHHWLCGILQLAAAILMLKGLERGSSVLCGSSGLLLGLAAFTLQDQGGYAVAGIILSALFVRGADRKLFLLTGGAAALAFILAAAPFALQASPGRLFHDWVYFPLFNYKAAGGNQFTLAGYLERMAAPWDWELMKAAPVYETGWAISSSFLLLTPFLSLACLFYVWFRRSRPRTELLIITVICLSFLLGAFHRLALTNLSWAFPALLPFYMTADSISAGNGKWRKYLSISLVSLLLAAAAGFSIARTGMCLDSEATHTLSTPAGSYRLFSPPEAKSAQGIVDEINRSMPADEPLFCVGYSPLINFLTRRPNPTGFNFMVPGGYYSKEQVIGWLSDINEKDVRWGFGEKPFMTAESAGKLMPAFEVVYENDRYILLKKKGPERSDEN